MLTRSDFIKPKSVQDWNKVRLLHDKWAHQVEYYIPTKFYMWAGVLSFFYWIFKLADGQHYLGRNLLTTALVVWVWSLIKVYSRAERTEGYVHGFDQGIDFSDGEFTLDELLRDNKPERKESKNYGK